ncbi:hypothetical protein D3C87_1455930 [compost metagenome]
MDGDITHGIQDGDTVAATGVADLAAIGAADTAITGVVDMVLLIGGTTDLVS